LIAESSAGSSTEVGAEVSNESRTDVGGTENVEQSANPAVKKRRNRWGDAPVEASAEGGSEAVSGAVEADETAKRIRKSRWSTADASAEIAPLSQEVIQSTMMLKVQLEQTTQRLVTVNQDAARYDLFCTYIMK
jgi:hypothetical protein